jgi:hypothetical protein
VAAAEEKMFILVDIEQLVNSRDWLGIDDAMVYSSQLNAAQAKLQFHFQRKLSCFQN